MKIDYKEVVKLSEELLDCAECNYGTDEEAPKCDNCLEIDLILRNWGY